MRIAFDFMNNPNPKVFYKELVGFICFWIFKFSFWRLLLIVICWNICCTPSDYPEQAVQIQQSFYDTSPHESFSKADRFGLQRQHLCDEQQGSHEGEIFSGKACIFWWLSSSVLPERNRKEKATGTVESVWQLSTLLNQSSIAAAIRTTTSNY